MAVSDIYYVVWNLDKIQGRTMTCKQCIDVGISYVGKSYEEINQLEDFGFEDFVSNLGGFIGIFLGYSMMQTPQLLGTYFDNFRLHSNLLNEIDETFYI